MGELDVLIDSLYSSPGRRSGGRLSSCAWLWHSFAGEADCCSVLLWLCGSGISLYYPRSSTMRLSRLQKYLFTLLRVLCVGEDRLPKKDVVYFVAQLRCTKQPPHIPKEAQWKGKLKQGTYGSYCFPAFCCCLCKFYLFICLSILKCISFLYAYVLVF